MQGEEVQEDVQELGISTAKRGALYLFGKFSSSIVVLVLLIFLARYLQPAPYGLYSIAVAFSSLLGIGGAFGIGTAFRKMLPEMKKDGHEKINDVISSGYLFASLMGLVIGIVGYLASGYIAVAAYGNPALTLPLQLASISVFIGVLFNLALAVLVGLYMVKEAAISNIVYSLVNLFASVGLVLLGYGVAGAVAGMVLGLLAGALIGMVYMALRKGHRFTMPKRNVLKGLTKFSTPVVASHVATLGAQNFAVLFLGLFATASIVGNYGAAFKLARFIELSITSITFVLLPAFSVALSEKNSAHRIGSIYNKSLYYTALLLFPLVAYMAATAIPWMHLLVSSQYTFAPQYFAFIVVGMALGLIGAYAGTLIIGEGDTKRFMKYQLIAVVVQVALLLALTPEFLALGVLIALFAVTPIVLDVIYMKALEEQYKFKHELKAFLIIAAVSVILGLVMYYASMLLNQGRLAIIADAVLAILAFPPLLALTKSIKKENLEFLGRVGSKMKPAKPIIDLGVRYTAFFMRGN